MKRVPDFKTDKEAEDFLDQDLSDLDFSQFKPVRFEIKKKEASLNMRIPISLLDAIREKAKKKGVSYAKYVRMTLEADINSTEESRRLEHNH